METVQQKMGDLITKPKMSAKVLSKPPFRFLHDTISAVTRTTGFGEGLYDGPELDSAAITDRQAKIDYLNKIFSLVGICKVRFTFMYGGLLMTHERSYPQNVIFLISVVRI